jgi:hypothetical protein|uniref:Uncharacterized protein n=1 Tax=Mus musculus TaxID=10090 RepID=Q8BT71_MOUSE|nr:unnamed protein product [Mus musculus]
MKTKKIDRRAVPLFVPRCPERRALAAVQVGSPGSGACGQVAPPPLQPLPTPVTPGPELGVGMLVGWEFVFFFLLFCFVFLNNTIGYIHFP